MRKTAALDVLPFWRSLLEHPRRIGSILPSGRMLGEAIVREVLTQPPGHVIELGAGTGSITKALFRVRDRFESFSVIERSPRLATHLTRTFPEVDIRTLCASRFDEIHAGDIDVMTVVSSLPFNSLPEKDRLEITEAVMRQNKRCQSFRFIQYSYLGRLPFRHASDTLSWTKKTTILANVPPATVWLLTKKTHAGRKK